MYLSNIQGLQQRPGVLASQEKNPNQRHNRCSKAMASETQEKSLPKQGRENHVGHLVQDDLDPSIHVVCERQKEAEERLPG